jgi:hypothetical protein
MKIREGGSSGRIQGGNENEKEKQEKGCRGVTGVWEGRRGRAG